MKITLRDTQLKNPDIQSDVITRCHAIQASARNWLLERKITMKITQRLEIFLNVIIYYY
jgi:hypothetical protein